VGRVVVVVGVIITAAGLLMMLGVPFGRLPGDVIIRRGNATFYFPLGTSIRVSGILTLVFALLRR
jgi:hypothetical protein